MKKSFIIAICLLPIFAGAQSFVIDKTAKGYSFNERELSSGDKKCRVFNCTNQPGVSTMFNPLLVIKVFDLKKRSETRQLPQNAIAYETYLSSVVIPGLLNDQTLNVYTLEPQDRTVSARLFDSLIVYNGTTYEIIEAVVVVEFFDVASIPGLYDFQATPTLFNLAAEPIKVTAWLNDSIPSFGVKSKTGKIFLCEKRGGDYIFLRYSFRCQHCSLSFYNEYVYRNGEGVIAFKSKNIYYHQSNHPSISSGIYESNEYYYFR